MAEFADRMTSLTGHLRTSIQMRNEARKQVHDAAADLSNRTQAFMAHVTDENRTRAEELRESLAAHREECRQKAHELRAHHQESLEKMRSDMNHVLTETRKTRHDTVNQLFHTFQHARNELALDLREASFAWHAFAADRDEPTAPTSKPRAKPAPSGQAHEPTPTTAKPRAKSSPSVRAMETTARAASARTEPAASTKTRSKPRRGK
jgi:hypothetical protein